MASTTELERRVGDLQRRTVDLEGRLDELVKRQDKITADVAEAIRRIDTLQPERLENLSEWIRAAGIKGGENA